MGHDEAIIFQEIYGVLTPELRQMRDDMLSRGVTECAMESTAVYWVPVWNEFCGSMSLKLVNPYFIKQLPGRKSDVKDAQWIAECVLKNLIKGSFVPGPAVQDMRKLNRRIMDLNEDMTYNCNKLDAALQRCGFRLSNYVASTKSKSYQSLLKAIIGGQTSPDELIKLVHGRTLNKHGRETVKAAVTASFSKTDLTIFGQLKESIDLIKRQIEECQKELTALCKEHFPKQYERIQTIPGVKERAATAIIAETRVDMKMFTTAACLVGWCGLKPRNDVSNFRQSEKSHLMENMVYNELRMRGFNVDVGVVPVIHRGEDGKQHRSSLEVDFVCNLGSRRYYIQSAYRMESDEKIRQERASLLRVDDSFKKIIVTGEESPVTPDRTTSRLPPGEEKSTTAGQHPSTSIP